MHLTTYLNFNGDCAEAFRFYEEHLGGKIVTIMTHGQMPDPGNVDPDWKDKVLHARIDLGETVLMGADIPHAQPTRSSYLALSVDNIEEAERIYPALSEGGEVFMPLAETFFAHRFAQFRDKFGILWMLLNEKPMGPAH